MFKKILLPLDLTDKHGPILDMAAEMALQGGGEVTLLHVIETIPGLVMEEEKTFYQRLERAARAQLDRWGKQLAERKVTWRPKILYGNRAQESVRYAAETETELVILTAPRLDPAHPGTGWGSMSYKIGFWSQCPVLLVK